ncbi:uncharacterized protein CC84DRAFT_1121589 [Paraphaeosphaeria sporulosa]|uniref:Tachykinin family protein n=1 Tax=Paraphaeosphaeria sporulosa TaxID=1460663 RepID=A0A177CAZ7_9PLEO|nr:uncharacterized protein CC84DRAFT_1121589 [Paraphaeosphaeria sporulosa]OAG04843.1 hypothetical protein CC84DRAFT_1121589 [Paraphaeosphaeria sporulosa]
MDRSAKPIFNFVNLSHPDELKDEQTQLRIRRLAMSEVGRARRKPKTKRGKTEIVLKFREPAESSASIGHLGAGDVDPFALYPIDLDEKSRALVASIFRANSAHSRQLRGAWWPVGLSGVATFYNVLANARLFQLKELTGAFVQKSDSLSLSMQSHAIRAMRERMQDAKHHASDETIGAVGSFMCHYYVLGNFVGWDHHRDAIARMVGMRGGVDNITDESLRITISWADLVGSFSQDIPSIVALPERWQASSRSPPGSPRPLNNISLQWKQRFPALMDWVTIFDDIDQLIMLDRGFTEKDKHLAETTGCWMEPTMVRLLAIRPLNNGSDAGHVMEEVCRFGTMLFLAPIWRWLGASPVWTFTLTRSLISVLHGYMIDWGELKPLLVWTVYFAALETRDTQERSQFAFMLAVLMSGMRVREWDELIQVVKSVLWVDRIFSSSDESIRDEVVSILRLPGTGDVTPVLEEIEGDEA